MLGGNIEQLRKQKGLTQDDLSRYLGLSKSTISMYESEKRSPDNETLLKLANYFGVTTDYLLGNEQPAKNEEEMLIDKAYLRVTEQAKKYGISPHDMDLALNFLIKAKERDNAVE